jgi:hypothetical protein
VGGFFCFIVALHRALKLNFLSRLFFTPRVCLGSRIWKISLAVVHFINPRFEAVSENLGLCFGEACAQCSLAGTL